MALGALGAFGAFCAFGALAAFALALGDASLVYGLAKLGTVPVKAHPLASMRFTLSSQWSTSPKLAVVVVDLVVNQRQLLFFHRTQTPHQHLGDREMRARLQSHNVGELRGIPRHGKHLLPHMKL